MIFDPGSDRRKDILYVHGSKGTIVSDVGYNQEGRVTYTVTSGSKVYNPTINVPQNYMLEVEQLGRCIERGEEQHITPEFSIKNAELLDKILEQIGY
jgi:predicted dehydrogenase